MAFGGSGGFGSSGFGTNNNQQSGTGLFGSGGGFGSTNNNNTSTGFGTSNTGSAFGSTNTGGGLFGGASNSNTSGTGFGTGGFGNTNTGGGLFGNNNTSKPAFGSNTASSGGGLFGGSGTTGSGFGSGGGGFGTTNTGNTTTGFGGSSTGGGLFGSGNTASSGFGTSSGSGLFGGGTSSTGFGNSNSTSTGFGTGGSAFGSANNTSNQTNNAQAPGTGGTPFSAIEERDGVGSATNRYQSIAFQQPYQPFSFEELRLVDYEQGRKYANQSGQAGAFGQSTSFGSGTTGTGFGTGGGFGSNSNTAFGSNNNNTANTSGGFGAGNTSGAFGSNSSGGLFGQNKPATGGLFGNNAATTTQSTPSLFGTSNTGSAFGSNNNATSSTPFGQQSKPLFGGTTSNNAFGGSSNNSTGGGLFGSSTNNNTTQQSGGFSFGNQNSGTQNQSGGFGFGNNNNNNNQQQQKPGGLFGTSTSTAGGSLFGNNNQQAGQQTSAFGTSNNQSTGGGLFGAKPATSSPFGNTQNNNTSGGLFGGLNSQPQQNNQNTGGGLFGAPKPGGLFGTNTGNTGGSSLFGSNQNNQQQQTSGTNSLFGGSTQQPQQQQQQPSLGGSLFGASQQSQQPQQAQSQQLTASIMSQNPYGHEHLFANLGTPQPAVGPLATPLSSSQKARRPAPLPAYKINPSASTRLITPQKRPAYGFSYSTYGTPGSAYGSPAVSGSLLGGGRSLNKSLSANNLHASYSSDNSLLRPGAFSPSDRSSRSTGSMKKLHINRGLRTENTLFGSGSDTSRTSPLKKTVSFDSDAQPNGETSGALILSPERQREESETASPEEQGLLRSKRALNGNAAAPAASERTPGSELSSVPEDGPAPASAPRPSQKSREETIAANAKLFNQEDMVPGDYWMKPSSAELKKLPRSELRAFKGLEVGRHGVGKIEFGEVNLEGIDPDSILSEIVKLELRSVTVYPEHGQKPANGKGLNVPSVVYLDNSWPRAKAGREKVLEKKGPRYDKHIERLRRVGGTAFVEYKPETGTWVFRVEHFSSYGLDYADDDDMSSSMLSAPPNSMPRETSGAAFQTSLRSQLSNEEVSMLSNGSSARHSNVEDTFEFRKLRSMPGGFDEEFLAAGHDLDSAYQQNPLQSFEEDIELVEPALAERDLSMVSDGSNLPEGPPGGLDGAADDAVFDPAASKPKSILKSGQRAFGTLGTPSKPKAADQSSWAAQLQRTLSPKKQDRQVLRQSQGAIVFNRAIANSSHTSNGIAPQFATSLDIMNSLFGKDAAAIRGRPGKQSAEDKGFKWPYAKRSKQDLETNGVAEHDKALHHGPKPTWNTDGTLLLSAPEQKVRGPLGLRAREAGASQPFPPLKPSKTFDTQRQLSSILTGTEGIPRAQMKSDFSFATIVGSLEETDAATRNERTMWELAQVLFDAQDSSLSARKLDIKRKNDLSLFWKGVVTPSALEKLASAPNAEEKALAYLSAEDIWSATEALINGADHRLATAISQLGGSKPMRDAFSSQINHWRETNVLSEIPARIRALYELLAGNTCVAEGKTGAGPENRADTFNLSSRFEMDWRRAFGLKLWYGILPEQSIAEAVDLYSEDLASQNEQVLTTPWFVDGKSNKLWADDPAAQERQDVLFTLLDIYAQTRTNDTAAANVGDLAEMLAPENVSGHPLDARLSFQLYNALLARGIVESLDSAEPGERDAAVNARDQLTTTLAAQLSGSSTTLVDAIFVLLHLTSPTVRAEEIKALLARHAAALGDGPEKCPVFRELYYNLKIPATWLWTAKALHASSVLHDPSAQALCLLRAGDLNPAHAVLARTIGPRSVVEEDLPGLQRVLAAFEASHAPTLPDWRAGGALYSHVATVASLTDAWTPGSTARPAIKSPRDGHDLSQHCTAIRAVLPGEEAWHALELEQRVAIVEIRALVGRVEAELDRREPGGSVKIPVSRPALGLDRTLQDAQRLNQRYYARAGLV